MTTSGGCEGAVGCTPIAAESLGIFHNQSWSYNAGIGAYDMIENTTPIQPWQGFWGATLKNADGLSPKLLVPVD